MFKILARLVWIPGLIILFPLEILWWIFTGKLWKVFDAWTDLIGVLD